VLVAGSPEFFDYFEGLNGKKRIVVEAKDGDTLATLGRRYGMSVGWMERINRRSRKKKLEAGDKLVVYVPGGRVPAKVAGAADSDSDEPWVIEPGPGDTTPASVPPSSDKPSAGG
jgi:LysM repeat protein